MDERKSIILTLVLFHQRKASPRPRPQPWLLRSSPGQAPDGHRRRQLRRGPRKEAPRRQLSNQQSQANGVPLGVSVSP